MLSILLSINQIQNNNNNNMSWISRNPSQVVFLNIYLYILYIIRKKDF